MRQNSKEGFENQSERKTSNWEMKIKMGTAD
jgi:hypothetical protein